MFAIAFDLVISDLKKYYGEPHNNAYFEIRTTLRAFGFFNVQGSVYVTDNRDMANLVCAIYENRAYLFSKII
jgi:virulence-associated protein VapD